MGLLCELASHRSRATSVAECWAVCRIALTYDQNYYLPTQPGAQYNYTSGELRFLHFTSLNINRTGISGDGHALNPERRQITPPPRSFMYDKKCDGIARTKKAIHFDLGTVKVYLPHLI
jgi:hypothetical protein